MTSKSKNKGNCWERDISKFLSEIFGENFVRVPNSGAFTGGKNNFRKKILTKNQISSRKGDIQPPDSLCFLNIEAKNYSNINFHQIINGSCTLLNNWINQTEISANENDLSFTIFKISRKGSWVCFSSDLFKNFNILSYAFYVKDENNSYIVTDFELFFKNNFKKIIELSGKIF